LTIILIFAIIKLSKEREIKMKYLIMECRELDDQCECEVDRFPICLTDDYSEYNSFGYEVYEVNDDYTFKSIKEYFDIL
jgi:hypothetical protein